MPTTPLKVATPSLLAILSDNYTKYLIGMSYLDISTRAALDKL
ncbi:hypothetical protein [Sporosarcina sp. P26b]|nr:hypothetical protein [Sporosarcina sp. P26b]